MCGFFPESEFTPVEFFAEVPAVVAPENDDGIVGIEAFIQSIDNSGEASINEAYGCKIALNGFSPLVEFDDLLVVAFRFCELSAHRRDIIEVVFVDVRQSYFVWRIHIEIFFRHIPGQVRAEEAATEEKGLVELFL